jgi:peptidoglycan/xylan/chitin deacetylase (PgdA/CDA1 family)
MTRTSRLSLIIAVVAAIAAPALAMPVEIHQHLELAGGAAVDPPTVALTLDACGGGFDAELVDFLIRERIPATVFATGRWIDRNPDGVRLLLSRPDLFEIEDHGAAHVPAVIGSGRRIYGLRGEPDLEHLKAEVLGGARAIELATGHAPRYQCGATAIYDPQAVAAIEALGFRVAGFSLNADAGATLREAQIIARVRAARSGDVIIAHVNKPRAATGGGLAVALSELLQRGYRFVRLDASALTDASAETTAAAR